MIPIENSKEPETCEICTPVPSGSSNGGDLPDTGISVRRYQHDSDAPLIPSEGSELGKYSASDAYVRKNTVVGADKIKTLTLSPGAAQTGVPDIPLDTANANQLEAANRAAAFGFMMMVMALRR